eukprot:1193887-Prorocentrum_minimum.AAC.1
MHSFVCSLVRSFNAHQHRSGRPAAARSASRRHKFHLTLTASSKAPSGPSGLYRKFPLSTISSGTMSASRPQSAMHPNLRPKKSTASPS